MAEEIRDSISNGLTAADLANYPLACREAFLAQSRKCQTASHGAKVHFIYPKCDEILDDWLLWLSIYGD